MSQPYSQLKAMMAITKASLTGVFRSPSAVIFSFVFPLIFILVFGFIGNSGRVSVRVAFDPTSDTTSIVYKGLKSISALNVVEKDSADLVKDLEKGRIAAIISLKKDPDPTKPIQIHLKTSEAVNPQNIQVLRSIMEGMIKGMNEANFPNTPSVGVINNEIVKIEGRPYRTIDFILPGQLGFSLLSAGVFGVAFIFFSLRQTLVLKRFFATPIKRQYIVLGEALSRVLFGMITAIVILLIGHYAFHFTLVNGWVTFFEMLVLSFLGLVVFMGFGFIVSGLAKNESVIPPFANLITLPQFLIGGTFFSTDAFPGWLKAVADVMPLKHLNDAMRNVAFEGAHLNDCLKQIGILALWGVIVYVIAIKVFRWE
ncbi:MAG TPA: ABC transporter permease [Chitinophagaceae bacterium]|nr:ABC transporter permease [Chitinophagaceae bacterium]